jgi:aminoglycoside N3'-acetyltransferase
MSDVRGSSLSDDLECLGIAKGDTVMVHASLKAIGPVEGGPPAIVDALLRTIGPEGNLLAYVSWDRSPYEETLNGRTLGEAERARWPAFDPDTSGTYRGFGLLNEFICKHPGARRSRHPDASMAAIGPRAGELVEPHDLGSAFGPGSPLARFVKMNGKVALLGAPLDAVTVIHYAEALAAIPGKRRVTYEMPFGDGSGGTVWRQAEDFDSNGILDCFAIAGQPDAVERIAVDYVRLGHHREGMVGQAHCYLFNSAPLVKFGVHWLESRFKASETGQVRGAGK